MKYIHTSYETRLRPVSQSTSVKFQRSVLYFKDETPEDGLNKYENFFLKIPCTHTLPWLTRPVRDGQSRCCCLTDSFSPANHGELVFDFSKILMVDETANVKIIDNHWSRPGTFA